MSATDVGWAPPGGVKDNKEEKDALAWKAWPLQLEQEICAEPRYRRSGGSRKQERGFQSIEREARGVKSAQKLGLRPLPVQ